MRFVWLLLAAALPPVTAQAHPLDEVVQGAYLTLTPGKLTLELDLMPGPLVVDRLMPALDRNRDKRITPAEAQAFGAAVLKQAGLKIDGVPAPFRLVSVSTPSYEAVRAGDIIKVFATAARPEKAGIHSLTFTNLYQPAKSQCVANIFLQPGAGWAWQVTGQNHSQDGRVLTVAYRETRA